MRISKKKVLIDSLIYTFLPKISIIASILILPIISEYLTLNDYGIYGLIISYVGVFQVITGFGQVVLLQNSFFSYGSNYKLIWRRSFGVMILMGILSGLFLSVILYFTMYEKLGFYFFPTIILMFIYLILSPIDIIILNFYTLNENPYPYAIITGLIGLFTTLVTLITIKYFSLGYLGWVISLALTSILSFIFFVRKICLKELIYPYFFFSKKFLKKSLNIGLPYTPHQLSLYILGISDRMLLEYFNVPIRQIGIYTQGYTMASTGNVLINGIFQALSKKIHMGFRSEQVQDINLMRKIIIYLPLLISTILFLAGLWSKEVFMILFKNRDLQESYPITIVVLGSYMFTSIYTFFSYILIIDNKTFSISKISLSAALSNLILNIILIPLYGIYGALIVTYLSYIIFGFAGLIEKENRIYLNRYLDISKACFLFFLVNLSFLVLNLLLMDSSTLIKLTVTLILLTLSFSSYKFTFNKKD
jgi:O-antigen/teichoic acid export membrane protein